MEELLSQLLPHIITLVGAVGGFIWSMKSSMIKLESSMKVIQDDISEMKDDLTGLKKDVGWIEAKCRFDLEGERSKARTLKIVEENKG